MPYHTYYNVICRVVIAGKQFANELSGSDKVARWGLRGSKVLVFAHAQRIKLDAFFPFLLSNSVSL